MFKDVSIVKGGTQIDVKTELHFKDKKMCIQYSNDASDVFLNKEAKLVLSCYFLGIAPRMEGNKKPHFPLYSSLLAPSG